MKDLKDYFSDAERDALEAYEKKMKAVRDKAIERRKADMKFWRQVDERFDEVYEYISQKRKERDAVKPTIASNAHDAKGGLEESVINANGNNQNRGGFDGFVQQ
ncbi:MAG: hypothetical protein E7188_03845 [Erysipelotrichaceae bacterium]|nr:hypothetical protein [Erysipelotrichaceae bacterium]